MRETAPSAIQYPESSVFRRTLVRAVLYPVLLLLILSAVFLWQVSNLLRTNDHVQHSNRVIGQTSVLLNLLVDMETGLRGYLLTDESTFLDPYRAALPDFDEQFALLQDLVSDNADQTSRLNDLRANVDAWQQFATQSLDGSDNDRIDTASQLEGKRIMDGIRGELRGFVEAEDLLRSERIRVAQTTAQAIVASVVIAGSIAGVTLAWTRRQQLVDLAQSYGQALITTRQQASELAVQQEWLRGVLSSIGDGVIAADIQGRITFMNQVAESLTGWSAQEAANKPLTDVYNIVHHKKILDTDVMPAVPSAVTLSPLESTQLMSRQGQAVSIDSTMASIKDERGTPLGTVVVFRDVTRREFVEQERLQLIETQSRYADKLRRSNQNLQEFAYIASHDLQEPIRMVISYLQLLERRYGDVLQGEAREFMDYAVDGATRMRALIMSLLTYARLDTVEKKIEGKVSLQTILDQVLKNLSVAIAEGGATVTFDEMPQLEVDSVQMSQLFQNLINNALKFRTDKPVQIHIGAEQHGSEWQFSVRDNGIGIPNENREKIFTLFQRFHRRGQYEGTGIGLAVCRKVIERHNGRIWVESEVGKGTTFYFTLPIKHVTF